MEEYWEIKLTSCPLTAHYKHPVSMTPTSRPHREINDGEQGLGDHLISYTYTLWGFHDISQTDNRRIDNLWSGFTDNRIGAQIAPELAILNKLRTALFLVFADLPFCWWGKMIDLKGNGLNLYLQHGVSPGRVAFCWFRDLRLLP